MSEPTGKIVATFGPDAEPPVHSLSIREVISLLDDNGRPHCPYCGRFADTRTMVRRGCAYGPGGVVSLLPQCTHCAGQS